MTVLRVILGDQLSESISSLDECDKENDLILMCEVLEEATYVKHHKKKIVFLFSAMRHFGKALKETGYQINYVTLDDPDNTGSFEGEVKRVLKNHDIKKIVITHPGEYRVLENMLQWEKKFNLPVEIRDDNRFICHPKEFSQWAEDRKNIRMEFFYRDMRKKHNILMNNDDPIGGQWNFDAENRKVPKQGLKIPATFKKEKNKITDAVIELVSKRFKDHFGDIQPFDLAVTRKDALEALKLFIDERLACFGDYQDAMIENEPWMYHSHISFYLNCGLLLPMECISAAENAYKNKKAPLNAVEGFIRQILGWREYVRGIYWMKMPGYQKENFFNAKNPLPEFYWSAKTNLNCLKQCITETKENAYAHHIQRLMVLGNFSLLAGINPEAVNEWYLIVYADAYEWVELPNVTGMILFADGGYLASKPYAAGGNYINKMSNYCENCHFNVKEKNGKQACPFNYLYWDFLERNRKLLEKNHRIGMMYRTYDRMSVEKKKAIKSDSKLFLKSIFEDK